MIQPAAVLSQEQENALLCFDEAWERGDTPDWKSYISTESSDTFLLELLHIDLERKLKSGLTARVETYVEACPELTSNDEAMIALISAEYRLRSQREVVTIAEYLGRFPHLGAILESRLTIAGEPPCDRAADSNTLSQEPPAAHCAETLPPVEPTQETYEQRPYLFLEEIWLTDSV
ncbi:MAG: hypothetical protein FJ271_30890 [Planctomycetes bacterium]|nr:hypothetical protein [Planctomycetota bacterium]